MRIFKIREFSKCAAQEGVVDNVLRQAVAEIYLNYNNKKLNQAVKAGVLIEVTSDE